MKMGSFQYFAGVLLTALVVMILQTPEVQSRRFCFLCANVRNISECVDIHLCDEGEVCFGSRNTTGNTDLYSFGCAQYSKMELLTITYCCSMLMIRLCLSAVYIQELATRQQCPGATTLPPTTTLLTTVQPSPNSSNNATTSINGSTTFIPIPTKASTTSAAALNTLGMNKSAIMSTTPVPGALVGRSLRFLDDDPTNQQPDYQCCDSPRCNINIFKDFVSTGQEACHDKYGFDCESINATYPFCEDKQHAKLVCKRFCGLCDLVDGQWSEWSNFTKCDVTCGNGTKMRTRTCTNPAPKNDGLNCTGNATEIKPCNPRACPVHGGWANWVEWSDCSVTCGVGLRVRDRNCSNPLPDIDGLFCFGRATDEELCYKDYCEEGRWNDWSSWNDCSKSCGSGIRHRHRNCSGDNLFTRPCVGDSSQSQLCNPNLCAETQTSAFFVTGPPYEGDENNTIAFRNVITNIGDDYNITTGKFVTRIGGLYEFFISIEKQAHTGQAYCHLMYNDVSKLLVAARSSFIDTDSYQQASSTAILHLKPGDEVYLGQCTAVETMSKSCSFSGILMKMGK